MDIETVLQSDESEIAGIVNTAQTLYLFNEGTMTDQMGAAALIQL